LLALFALAPAVFEEVAFRGIIFERLRRVLGEREGWLVQAAFFSVLHLSPVIFLTHFAMGLILGWLRIRARSLLPCMILHASWNAASIVLELYQ
jgi:membrane protease YdiL (CAAX protease family)